MTLQEAKQRARSASNRAVRYADELLKTTAPTEARLLADELDAAARELSAASLIIVQRLSELPPAA